MRKLILLGAICALFASCEYKDMTAQLDNGARVKVRYSSELYGDLSEGDTITVYSGYFSDYSIYSVGNNSGLIQINDTTVRLYSAAVIIKK